MASKIKGLQQWCARRTEGYRDVNVTDMSTSWRDGLAFCAIIHRFRPDLIDFDSLSKENIFENNQLAFEVAEKELDIPAFLDAPDMVRMKKPDKLSIITYVSQYYNYFNGKPELGGPGISKAGAKGSNSLKRPSNDKKHNLINSQDSNKSKTGTLGDKCAICDGKVYLMERHIDNNTLYHRLCFRHSTMSPTNKVYNSPDDTSNVSKVRKIDHKTNGDVGGRKSLFPEKTKVNGNTSASKTPSKYHEHALEFLSRENDVGNSSSTPKNFTTSTPKSKYEDKTSLTVVPTSSATASNSVLDNKSKYSSQLDKVQSSKSKEESKFSLPSKTSDKIFSDSLASKTKETSKLFESTTSQPEPPKSGLRDFLKKYNEKDEKENKSVSNPAKTFDKMEVDNVLPSPITRTKIQHNVAKTTDNSELKSWRTETNGVKSPVLKHKFDVKSDSSISDRYNGSKNSASSTASGTSKHLDTNKTSALNSYQSHLNKTNDAKAKGSKVSDELVNKFSKTSEESRTKAFSDSKFKPKSDFVTSTAKSDFLSSKPKGEISVTKPKTDFSSIAPRSDILSSKPKTEISGIKTSKFSDSSINKSSDFTSNKFSKDILKPSNDIKSSIFDKKTETRSETAISDLTKKKDTTASRYTTDSSYLGTKDIESKKPTSPVPKPRGILKTSRLEEDMDTSESNISKTSLNLKPTATPRTVHNITSIKEDLNSQRPKSPVLSRLKLSSASASEITDKKSPRDATTPETPPPLPFSPPPSISIATPPTSPPERKTQVEIKSAISKPKRDLVKKSVDEIPPALPSRSYIQDKKSSTDAPPLPPRTDLKITSQDTFVIGQNSSPGRPPRLPLDNKTRKETPMSIDEAIHKAMSPETSPEPVAVFVSPSPSSSGDQNILGGLLKSLAGVRQKSPPEVSVQQFDFNKQHGGHKTKLTDVKDQEPEVKLRRLKKEIGDSPAPVLNIIKKKDPERPKSVHTLLDSYNNNSKSEEVPSWKKAIDSRSSNRPKSVAMVTQVDEDVPSWKQNMELKKVRAKSATSVEDPNDFGKLTWQRDAAKRMAKNKHFVDPEFEKVPQKPTIEDKLKEKEPKISDFQSSQLKDKRKLPETPFSPNPPIRKAPERPKSPVTNRGLKERCKSPVNIKKAPERPKSPPKYTKRHETPTDNGFRHYNNNTELDKKNLNNNKYRVYPESTHDNRAPDPPLRKIVPGIKFDFDNSMDLDTSVQSNNRNNNPTTIKLSPPKPLKIDISPKRYSPFEIRNDLIDIDKKLTELELRGRNLEDTIRNATTSEVEDELMTEWFKLINEKNELVRKEADLIYINREQELEDEQDSIDSRLRYLMSILDEDKTVDEREEEEELINKKLDVINKRSSIIDSMDEDRIRYEEEDRDIAKVLYSKGYDISGEEQIKKMVEEENLSGKKKKNKIYI